MGPGELAQTIASRVREWKVVHAVYRYIEMMLLGRRLLANNGKGNDIEVCWA